MKVSDELRQVVAEAMWKAVISQNPNKISFQELLANFHNGDDNAIMFFSQADAALTAAIPLILEEAAKTVETDMVLLEMIPRETRIAYGHRAIKRLAQAIRDMKGE